MHTCRAGFPKSQIGKLPKVRAVYLCRKDIFALEVVHATDLWELFYGIILTTILATFGPWSKAVVLGR